ncbi:uncharacterized protein LOC143609662 [Bidens hawaiensis]|uniref:uncharacterized protein LOC143609662 n=1 Tax=Bidens hawaiensis TaxID=980011 RepID=UPI00404ACBAB
MKTQKFTILNEIDVLKTSPSTLKVKVLRLWSIKDNKNVNEDFLIEMVLMDEDVSIYESENRIQASVYKQDIFRFKRFLKESSTLTIVNPSVDIIGYVVHVFKSNASNVKDKNKRTMKICDLSGNCVYLTLWDHYASELSKYVIEHFDESQAIIVLQFGISITPVLMVKKECMCRILLDLILLGLLNGNDVSVRKSIPVKMLSSVDEDLRVSLSLVQLRPYVQIQSGIILAVILVAVYSWKNNGEGGNEYECKTERCNVLGVLLTPRFKIKIRVQDSIGVVSLTLFDRDAKMLINKTAAELIDSQKQNEVENGGFPVELDCLLEKKFAFKVDVAEFNFRNNVEDYGINKLTDDTNILTELQKRQNSRLQTDSNSVSLGASMSEFQSSSSVSVKISDIGDNQNPSSNVDQDVANEEKGMSTSSDDKLKRKLVEVFEVDDQPSMSATKFKSKTIEEMGNTSESCDVATTLPPNLEKDSK